MQTLEDAGSPVDVAKSYMRARPPWASPSKDISPPSPLGIQLFKENAPHLINKNSILSPKVLFDIILSPFEIMYIFGFCFVNPPIPIGIQLLKVVLLYDERD